MTNRLFARNDKAMDASAHEKQVDRSEGQRTTGEQVLRDCSYGSAWVRRWEVGRAAASHYSDFKSSAMVDMRVLFLAQISTYLGVAGTWQRLVSVLSGLTASSRARFLEQAA